MLSETIDTSGNLIRYSYMRPENGPLLLEYVKYPIWRNPANGAETAPLFTVEISYDDRDEIETSDGHTGNLEKSLSYREGFRVSTEYAVTEIQVMNPGSDYDGDSWIGRIWEDELGTGADRYYDLSYTRGDNGYRMLLGKIQHYFKDGAEEVGPVVNFDYSANEEANRTWTDTEWGFPGDTGIDFLSGPVASTYLQRGNSRLADVNGDGLIDLFSGSKVYVNSGSGWFYDPTWDLPSLPYPDGTYDNGLSRYCPEGDFQLDLEANIFRDISEPDHPSGYVYMDGRDIQLADLNGDGRTDIFAAQLRTKCNRKYNHTAYQFVPTAIFLSSDSGWEDVTDEWNIPSGIGPEEKEVSFWPSWSYVPYNRDQGFRLADINADGYVDIVYSQIDDEPHFYLGTGSGWEETDDFSLPVVGWCQLYSGTQYEALAFSDGGSPPTIPLGFQDVNNDGLLDLVLDGEFCIDANYPSYTTDKVYLNTGRSWSESSADLPYFDDNDMRSSSRRFAGDINGDRLGPDMTYSFVESDVDRGGVLVSAMSAGMFRVLHGGEDGSWGYPLWTASGTDHLVGFEQKCGEDEGAEEGDSCHSAIQVADLDGDGLGDIFALNAPTSSGTLVRPIPASGKTRASRPICCPSSPILPVGRFRSIMTVLPPLRTRMVGHNRWGAGQYSGRDFRDRLGRIV